MKKIIYTLLTIIFVAAQARGQYSSMQIINNIADNFTDSVDIYLDGSLLADNLGFREATDFFSAPTNINFHLSIAAKNSSSVADSIYSASLYFDSASRHVIVINGILSASGYNPAPPVFYDIYDSVRDLAANVSNVDILFHNGSTDAVPLNIYVNNSNVASFLYYRSFSDYASLGVSSYTLEVTDTNGSLIGSYSLPLQALSAPGEVNTIIASGFMNPSSNSNGPSFGLYMAKKSGGPLIALPSLATKASNFLLNGEYVILYPNPATTALYVTGNIDFGNVAAEVYDITGTIAKRFSSLGSRQIDISTLVSGVYFLRMEVKGQYVVQQFLKQ